MGPSHSESPRFDRILPRAARFLAAISSATLISVLCLASLAADPPEAATTRQLGPFSLDDVHGAKHTAQELRTAKAVVLFFIDTECPVSNLYTPLMQRTATKYADQGLVCYGVHSNPTTTAAEAASHADEYGLKFPILIDHQQRLARAAGVRVTPEAVVATGEGKVLYRGRLDDRYSLDGKRRDEPRERDLEAALEAVLSGREPKVRETKAYGCPLPKLKTAE